MRLLSVACVLAWVSVAVAQVTVTETHITTPHDSVPRFGGKVVQSDEIVVFEGDFREPFIEVLPGGRIIIEGSLVTNTILVHPGAVMEMEPGSEILFQGEIPDKDGSQYGLGLIVFGHLEAKGTRVPETWTRNGKEVDWIKSRDTVIRGIDRGHVLIIGEGTADISYVWFDNMGRTKVDKLEPIVNQIGRYSCHLHRVTSQGSSVHGCLFTRPLKWAGTIHDTHGSRWSDNVFIGDGESSGALLATEMGNETDHVITGNLFVNSKGMRESGRDHKMDNGFEGHGLWLHSQTDLVVEDNLAVDCSSGYTVFSAHNPSQITKPDGTVIGRRQYVPKQWVNNDGVDCKVGLTEWPDQVLDPAPRVDCDFKDCHIGVSSIGGQLNLHDSVIDGSYRAIHSSNYHEIFVKNVLVKNCGAACSGTKTFAGTIEFENNDVDLIFRSHGWQRKVDITTSKRPSIQVGGIGMHPDRQDSVSNTQQRFVIRLPDKVLEVLTLEQLPDAPYPDDFPAGNHLIFNAETVGEAWEKYGMAPRYTTIELGDKVEYYDDILWYRSSTKLPVKIHENGLPPYVPKLLVHIGNIRQVNDIITINSIAPAYQQGDLVRVQFDGEQVWQSATAYWPDNIHVSAREVELITVQHLRRNSGVWEVIAHDQANFDGDPIDEREIELARLLFEAQQLEAEISGLEATLTAKREDLLEVLSGISALEEELGQ